MPVIRCETPIAGLYSVIIEVGEGDVGEDVTVDAAQAGVAVGSQQSFTIQNGFDNNDSSTTITAAATINVTTPGVPLDVTVEAVAGGTPATIGEVTVVPPDPRFGIAPISRDAAHCSPVAYAKDGNLLHMVTGLGDGRRYLSYNDQPLGEVFSTVANSDRQVDDTYHQGSAVTYADGQWLAFMTDHNQRLWCVTASTPQGLTSATPFDLTGSSEFSTYVQVVSDESSGGKCWAITRVNSQLNLVEIDNISTTPTVTTDVLMNLSGSRPYPRAIHLHEQDDSSDLLFIGYQTRVVGGNENWEKICGVVYDPATRQCYNIKGNSAGGTTLGTSGSPKLTNAQAESSIHSVSDAMALLDEKSSGTRYTTTMVSKAVEWNATTKRVDVGMPFADATNITDSTATGLDVRFCWYKGTSSSTRYVTGSTADIFGLDDRGSFRITAVLRYENNDPSNDNLELLIGVGSASPNDEDDYYDFGAVDKVKRYEIDVSSISSSTDLENAVTEQQTIMLSTNDRADVKPIGNSTGFIVRGEEFTNVHQTRSAGTNRIFGFASLVPREEVLIAGEIDDWAGKVDELADDRFEIIDGKAFQRKA